MKIRIGVGAAGASSTPDALAELVRGLDDLGFDSLWLSEVLTGPVIDPMVGLAWVAASNPRVKLGTTMLLPGRNVLRLAKQLASLDVLCRGRLLVTLVPGLTYAPEREAIGVEPKRRGAIIDEALPLLRRLGSGGTVSHEGAAGPCRWGCRLCVSSSSASSAWASPSSWCVRWFRQARGARSWRPSPRRSATSRPDGRRSLLEQHEMAWLGAEEDLVALGHRLRRGRAHDEPPAIPVPVVLSEVALDDALP